MIFRFLLSEMPGSEACLAVMGGGVIAIGMLEKSWSWF